MIHITDYIECPDVELSVIGEGLSCFTDKDIDHQKVEILLVWHFLVNEDSLRMFPNVKAIVRYGVGFDNIDTEYCQSMGIKVFNNPDYGVDEVSDTALSMIMSLTRCIGSYNTKCRELVLEPDISSPWQENTDNRARRLKSMQLGLVGAGRIGSALAIKMKSIVGKVHFFDPNVASGYEKVLNATRHSTIDELLAVSDIVSIHCPLSSSTQDLVDENFIKSMKDGAILVNTARGKIIESTECLLRGLVSGKLGGVGLDVLPHEPPIFKGDDEFLMAWASHHSQLKDRIIINPHTAYYSEESYQEMRIKAATCALMALQDKQLLNRVI